MGGVSSWCDVLIGGLRQIEWDILLRDRRAAFDVHVLATAVVTMMRNPHLAAQLGRRRFERLHRSFTLARCLAGYRELISEGKA